MKKGLILLSIMIIIFCGCEKITESDPSGELLSIKVVDTNGEPVSGLKVGTMNAIFNDTAFWGGENGRPYTTILFSIETESNVQIDVYNLFDEKIRTLSSEENLIGNHQIGWDGKDDNNVSVIAGGTNVFRYELTITHPETNDVIFQESKFMCLAALTNIFNASIGTTDSNGDFSYDNKLAFPNLFNLGEQAHTSEFGQIMTPFTFNDSIVIALYNPETEEYLDYTRLMESSDSNHYELIWSDPESLSNRERSDKYNALSEFNSNKSTTATLKKECFRNISNRPTENELGQNYPNPFN